MKAIIGWIAMCGTLLQVLGIVPQILKIIEQGSARGLAFSTFFSALLGFTGWATWAICKPVTWPVLIPNVAGVILTGILLCTMFGYGF
jgi:uncharacterized protein with PQ loop repeat